MYLIIIIKHIKIKNHLPSGTPTSQILSYLANLDMFDEIMNYCKEHNLLCSIYVDDITLSTNRKISFEEEKQLKWIGASPGRISGRVKVIDNPANAKLEQGEILVAEYTDPGWIMLFPAASGILVERGSLLSHSAIVSRELGIPAVVGITGLLDNIKTGDIVELDGTTGIVRKMSN